MNEIEFKNKYGNEKKRYVGSSVDLYNRIHEHNKYFQLS